jgi:phosphonate transport system permease protein
MNETKQSPSHPGWKLRQPYTAKHVFIILIVFVIAAFSAQRAEIYKGTGSIAYGVMDSVGLVDDSQVVRGWSHFFSNAFPLVLHEKTEVSRIQNFDRDNLPLLSYTTKAKIREYSIEKKTWIETEEVEYLIEPLGYLFFVVGLMFKTIEIAIWGTILAICIAIPVAFFSSTGYTPNVVIYNIARGVSSFNRAIPELISAMFMVLVFGFGPFPGVVALGIHSSGFLGKFFADDIENADKGPQEALRCIGANRLKVLRYAVIPQVLPQYMAYVQYILERNVRTATVLGIVGAGGIGMELSGRWDLSNFGHVSTILLIIFLTVFILEHLTQHIRKKLI